MKTYRLVTLAASALITVFLARFLANEDVGYPKDQAHVETAAVP
jgi:hypothetical protein